jgi:hypothetical protein
MSNQSGLMLYEVLIYIALLGFLCAVCVPETIAILRVIQRESRHAQTAQELLFINHQFSALFRTKTGDLNDICVYDGVLYIDCPHMTKKISNASIFITNFATTGTSVSPTINFNYDNINYSYHE